VQEPNQFRAGDRRMRVVHLDRHAGRQGADIGVLGREAAQDVAQRGGGEEEFLLQPQLLALRGGVVGIEHAADRAGQRLGLGGAGEIALVEGGEVEGVQRLGAPQAQGIGPFALPADHRRVKGLGRHRGIRGPDGAAAAFRHRAAKADAEAGLGAFEFPAVRLAQPFLGLLDLAAVGAEALAEQAVFVADAIAVGGAAQRRHRIEEARRQPAEATVAQRRVGFVVQHGGEIEAEARHGVARHLGQANVHDRVFQQTADQEFHRQVIDALGLGGVGGAGGAEPGLDDAVANRQRQRHAHVVDRGVGEVLALRELEVPQDRLAQVICTHRHRVLRDQRRMPTGKTAGSLVESHFSLRSHCLLQLRTPCPWQPSVGQPQCRVSRGNRAKSGQSSPALATKAGFFAAL